MAYRNRLNYTNELKSNIWNKYKAGESLWSIARSIDRHSSCIYGLLSRTGGIQPPDRKRASTTLSLSEREEISRGIAAMYSIRTIAFQLGPVNTNQRIRNQSKLDEKFENDIQFVKT